MSTLFCASTLFFAALLAAVITPLKVAAQTLTQPPPLIRLIQTSGANLAAPPRGTATGVPVIGMVSITGALETWLVEPHTSFTEMERVDAAYPALRNRGSRDDSSRIWIAFYRQWWSHRPEEAVQAMRRARYLQVSIFRISFGSEVDLAELLRARRASLDSINLDRPDLVYQIVAGEPSGTYLILSPLPSLKALDDGVSTSRSAVAYQRSTGTPSTRATSKVGEQNEVFHENFLFRIDPALSDVPEEFVSTDPGFWKQGKN
jgi:hypothetical protein